MAKGQKRSNRELKKPKQDKEKKSAGGSSAVETALRQPAPGKGAKQRG